MTEPEPSSYDRLVESVREFQKSIRPKEWAIFEIDDTGQDIAVRWSMIESFVESGPNLIEITTISGASYRVACSFEDMTEMIKEMPQ